MAYNALIDKCIDYAEIHQQTKDPDDDEKVTISPSSSLGLSQDARSSVTSFTHDTHAVSPAEAEFYYSGLPSNPKLVYRTGAPWAPPRGPEAYRRRKQLREVFNHPLVDLWNNGLSWVVVGIMDTHEIPFNTIDIVRFQTINFYNDPSDKEDRSGHGEEAVEVKKKPTVGPVTVWVGVLPDITPVAAAHEAAQAVLALLAKNQITDVDVDFRESYYRRLAGPQLPSPVGDLDPLVDVIGPLTPALGLHISTTTRPDVQGTMGLYLAEGGQKNRLLGLTCNHVLSDPGQASFEYLHHPSGPIRDVVLLGRDAHFKLAESITLRIAAHGVSIRRWQKQILRFVARENGNDPDDAAKAQGERIKTQALLGDGETALVALSDLLNRVEKEWKNVGDRTLGRVILAPTIKLGVDEEKFTEDWGVFRLNRDQLGQGFQGNKIDLGTNITPEDFTLKCFPRGDCNWRFEYPEDRLLPLHGVISNELMRAPDMWDRNGEPCLLVVKNGSATNTTLGRANGVFSVVRDYPTGTGGRNTSTEWMVINYDSKSGVFSEPGDSGAIIADIRGRIGGLLTGGAGEGKQSDMTYATPFWWLLRRMKAGGLPDVNLDVLE